MVEEPSNVKQLSLNHVCKIGINIPMQRIVRAKGRKQASKDSKHIQLEDSWTLDFQLCLSFLE
jgi:hypothetical protein